MEDPVVFEVPETEHIVFVRGEERGIFNVGPLLVHQLLIPTDMVGTPLARSEKPSDNIQSINFENLFNIAVISVFRIRISLNADPDTDPGFYLNADPNSGFWTLKTEIKRKF